MGLLEGTWLPVAARVALDELPMDELRVARLVLQGREYRILDRRLAVIDCGEFRVDAAMLPRAMDLIGLEGPNAGRTLRAIFELDGDELIVCYDLQGGTRPLSMVPVEDQLLLRITYARAPLRLAS
jgi:uncharacterized protein (TIGR03067 family)